MNKVITVQNLTKRYKGAEKSAVDDISFSVGEGEFFAFLGENGAGKTTTIIHRRFLRAFIPLRQILYCNDFVHFIFLYNIRRISRGNILFKISLLRFIQKMRTPFAVI